MKATSGNRVKATLGMLTGRYPKIYATDAAT